VSATQLVLVALVLVAFGLGWVARGRLESQSSNHGVEVREVDAALAAALTSFQAALGLWQLGERAESPLAQRTLATFEERRAAVSALSADGGDAATEPGPISTAQTALDRLSTGLAAWADGAPLDAAQVRTLLRAERTLAAARTAVLAQKIATGSAR
jgi:hypothetical protein